MRPYEVDHKGWTWVPVLDIIQQTEGSCDFDEIEWDYIIREKASDTGFLHLVNSIIENGWQSAIGWRDRCITEGHHRIVAAILLCEELIPTTERGTNYYSDDSSDSCGRFQSGHTHHTGQVPAPLNLEEFE